MSPDPQGTTLSDFSHLYPDQSAAPVVPTPETPGVGVSDFSHLYAEPKPQSTLERYMGWRAGVLDKVEKQKNDAFDAIGLKKGALRGLVDLLPSAMIAWERTTPSEAASAVGGGVKGLGELAGGIATHPVEKVPELMMGMVEGIVKPFLQSPIELMINQQLKVDYTKALQGFSATGGGFAPGTISGTAIELTPEEREFKGKEIGANIVGWVLGLKAESVVENALVGQAERLGSNAALKKVAKAITAAQKDGILTSERVIGDVIDKSFMLDQKSLRELAGAVIPSAYTRRAAGGVVGGAVGGGATGYLTGETPEERLQAGIGLALMAMPLGVAMASTGALAKFGKPAAVELSHVIAEQAAEIYMMRQMSMSTDQTIAQMLLNVGNLEHTQSFAAALALKHIEYTPYGEKDKNGVFVQKGVYGKNATVIPTNNPAELLQLVADHNKDIGEIHAITVVHSRADGLHDVLIAPRDLHPLEQEFFAKTGYVHGQQVSYAGSEHWVIEGQGKNQTSITQEAKYTNKDDPTHVYLVQKNTRPGEKPWRVSQVVDGQPASHVSYDTPEGAHRFAAMVTGDTPTSLVTQRQYRMKLRNQVTGEILDDIQPRNISKLAETKTGLVDLNLGRMLGRLDIYDDAQGFQSHGDNGIAPPNWFDAEHWNNDADNHISHATGEPITREYGPEPADVVKARRDVQLLEDTANRRQLSRAENQTLMTQRDVIVGARPRVVTKLMHGGVELKPGVNFLEQTRPGRSGYDPINRTTVQGDLKTGSIVYVGGEMRMVDVVDAAGNTIKTQVMVGNPHEIVAHLDWNEEFQYKNKPTKGSNGFYSYQLAPNYRLGTRALIEARIAANIKTSFSSLSQGGSAALANAINRHAADRAVSGSLLTLSPEAIKTRLVEGFLDHVGMTLDGNFLMDPNDIIMTAGFERGGYGTNNHLIGHPGETAETLYNRLATSRLRTIAGDKPARLFTESKRPLTLEEAKQLLHDQVRSDAVPMVRTTADRVVDRSTMSWNDLIQSFVSTHGIRPEMTGTIASFLEREIGQELLGMPTGNRSRLQDRTTIPTLQEQLNKAEEKVSKLANYQRHDSQAFDSNPDNAIDLANAKNTKEVFEARIKQINDAGPIPFTDAERVVYTNMMKEASAQHATNAIDLAHTAHTHGFTVEQVSGKIRLRDTDSNMLLKQMFDSPDDARDFINGTGAPKSIDLDGGGNNLVPPSAVGSHMGPPGPPPEMFDLPHQFPPNSFVSKVMVLMDQVLPWFTPKRAFMVAMDDAYKSRFYSDVYLPLQIAKMKTIAEGRKHLLLAKDIEDGLLKAGIPRDRWKIISDHRESMSPQNVVDHYLPERPLTQEEITYATKLRDDGIDIKAVYEYSRARDQMKKQLEKDTLPYRQKLGMSQDPIEQNQLKESIKKLEDQHVVDQKAAVLAFNMDKPHLDAADMFKHITTRPPDQANLSAIMRLSRSMSHGELDRAGFAAKNQMTVEELQASAKLDAAFISASSANGVDPQVLRHIEHFRHYTDAPAPGARRSELGKSMVPGSIDDTPQAAIDMIRSGEVNPYERDPIKMLIQYVNASANKMHFNEAFKNAQAAAKENLNLVPEKLGRVHVKNVIEEYVGGMKGAASPADQHMQGAFSKFLTSIGIDKHIDIRSGIIDTWLATSSAAMLGWRPAQGARDMMQFTKVYNSRFGLERFNNGLRLAYKRDANGVRMIEHLAQAGTVPGLNILQFAAEGELASGIAGAPGRIQQAIFDAANHGLKISAQHNAYALAHAIAYLDTKDLASKVLLKLSRGEITRDVAYKQLSMNSYDLPVAQDFDQHVMAGKFDEAAERLAHATGTETAFVMGLGNHPYLWGSNVGKIAGQFGQWSMWTRNYVTRLAGRGTGGERAAAIARFTSMEVATGVLGRTLGFNMRSWYTLPAVAFMGGPAYDYLQQVQDMIGLRGKMRQELATSQLNRGQIPIISNLTPGAYAFSDYFQAYQLYQNRYGLVPILGKGLGMAVDKTQRSFLDVLIGEHPRGQRPQ